MRGSPQTGEGTRQRSSLPSAFSLMNALVSGFLDEKQHHFHLPFLAYQSSLSCPKILHSHCCMKFKNHQKKALASKTFSLFHVSLPSLKLHFLPGSIENSL